MLASCCVYTTIESIENHVKKDTILCLSAGFFRRIFSSFWISFSSLLRSALNFFSSAWGAEREHSGTTVSGSPVGSLSSHGVCVFV